MNRPFKFLLLFSLLALASCESSRQLVKELKTEIDTQKQPSSSNSYWSSTVNYNSEEPAEIPQTINQVPALVLEDVKIPFTQREMQEALKQALLQGVDNAVYLLGSL